MEELFALDRREDLELRAHLAETVPGVYDALDGVRRGRWRPRRIRDRDAGGFVRFPEHYRSLTLPLERVRSGQPGVLVLKGCEPLLEDFEAFIEWMAHRSFRTAANIGHTPMLEHFALREHKVPGALTIAEALHECERALTVQGLHLRHYGELARLPLPLWVQRIDTDVLQSAGEAWRRHLSEVARERLRPLVDDGLGVFGYYYPALPVRLRGFDEALPSETPSEHTARLRGYDVETIVGRWITLLVRILYLGYLPYSFHNEGLGACFDPGNACMDGGFVDIDSLVPIASLSDDGAVFDALVASFCGLDRTIEHLLPNACEHETRQVLRRRWLWDAYRRAVDSEARPGLSLDPRVLEVLDPLPFGTLVKRLRSRQRYAHDFLESDGDG